MAELTERESNMAKYQSQLADSSKLESLQSSDNWDIIEKVLADLTMEFSGAILNGDPADHDKYLVNRAKLDGLRAVRDRLSTIIKVGQQAANAINTLNS